MPHRVKELDVIIAALTDLAQRANEMNELQLASTLVGAIGQARESKARVANTLEPAVTINGDRR
jgi:hypothetical protein